MGLCCCTMMGCPVGLCVLGPLAATREGRLRGRERLLLTASGVLALGFVCLYIPLTILCARKDEDAYALWKGDGYCWSEGNTDGYAHLGLAAGLVMGVGVTGIMYALFFMRATIPPDPTQQSKPIEDDLPCLRTMDRDSFV